MDIVGYLSEVSRLLGPSGHEGQAAEYLKGRFEKLCDEVRIDALGSVIALKKGEGTKSGKRIKLLLCAHQDEIALVVTEILKDGTLRIGSVGGVDPRILPAATVTVYGEKKLKGVIGSTPPHLQSAGDSKRNYKMTETYVDVGLPVEKVKKLVHIGDLVQLDGELVELKNDRVACKTMDDRACVGILLQMAENLQSVKHEADIYFVCSVQEEVGGIGALTAGYGVDPDLAIALDVTHATIPGSRPDTTCPIDAPAITFGPFLQYKLVDAIKKVADENGVKYNSDHTSSFTHTDADELQITRSGVPTALLALPLRYMHTTVETIDLGALRECARLLALFAQSVKEGWDDALWN